MLCDTLPLLAQSLKTIRDKPVYAGRIKKLYEASARVFRSLHLLDNPVHRASAVDDNKTRPSNTIRTAAEAYTRILYDYVSRLKYERGKEALSERFKFQDITAVWHLFEITLLRGDTSAVQSRQLMDWLNKTQRADLLKFDIQGIFNCSDPLNHPFFWPYVYKLVLRSEMDSLVQLLHVAERRANPSHDSPCHTLTWIITHMPSTPKYRHNTDDEAFLSEFDTWKQELAKTRQKYQSMSFSTPHFHSSLYALDILCGNADVIRAYASSSLEALVAILYYGYPLSTIDTIYQEYPLQDEVMMETRWKVFDKLFQGDVYGVLEECTGLDPWLLAHMCDLLALSGQLTEPIYLHSQVDLYRPVSIRSFFIMEYAASICSQSIWPYAFDYLRTCNDIGQECMNEIIKWVHPSDGGEEMLLQRLCEEYGLILDRS
ncbi:nucleoporin Nup85-like protein [Radiomyces spectabilis]|uniref:nucleoporin Nup85-like protein n=1 Tax=Radiomyces spectabilis TaxID=64574 RepID=UPI00221F805F|nr:nucleoporin Nup85-like protein [Radiomyces spectabilis]KAI8365345.1 nucleoporin Nup85-like protein [Radiomyces spectabilis]